ncbi:MAG: hypothetical protein IJ002_05830 [Clostridia bacterium]|nr:hypothetical protein [Clostridia bacterium]
MAKEKMVLFRSALGGFNRDDVNSYIEKQNAEFSERERTAKKKLDAAEAKCAELENKLTELENAKVRIAELEKEAETREKLIAEYIEKVEHQAAEIENLNATNDSAESEIVKLTEKIASLSEAIAKSEKYDDISNQIGEIILSARSTADSIVAKANEEAAEKRAAADAELENAAANFNARAATAAYAIKGQMKKIAQDSYATLAGKAAETSDLLRNLAAHISGAAEDFDKGLANGKSEAEAAISDEAAKIFTDENRLSFKK